MALFFGSLRSGLMGGGSMIRPDREEFKRRARQGNLITVYSELVADMETPVSAFMKLRRGGFNFLLESVEGGSQIGRYSFLGRDPSMIFTAKDDEVTLRQGADIRRFKTGRPLEELRKLLAQRKAVSDPDLPPFTGGAVGYLGYDMVRQFEKIPDENPDDLGVPDAFFLFSDTIVAFDNVNHKLTVMVNVGAREGDNLDLLYDQTAGVVSQILTDLRRPLGELRSDGIRIGDSLRSNFPKGGFQKAVSHCKRYIQQGDIIQAVLSQRLETSFEGDNFDLYRALRVVNPSPYMFFLEMEDMTLVGASPEVHVKARGRDVTIRPIAGTRPRGRSIDQDLALEEELLGDEKEKAEHLMLVDLARNDIGRVCDFGSVHVSEYQGIERYSHVMHIVSNVEGRLRGEKDAVDLIAATFPAGTVSGAPKIRAMEIIDELEPTRRGPYAGLVGYFDYGGNFDSCITIRTAMVKDGRITVQVGAGIVADSEPEREWHETLNKGRALFAALRMARAGERK
jgi:anthranilate synthase component 1